MMNLNLSLEDLVDELLSIERVELKEKPNFFSRIGHEVRNVVRRRDINKGIADEIDAERKRVISLGKSAEAFLNSPYYKQFIDSFIRSNVKGGLQKILKDYETLTPEQLKMEIAGINKCLRLLASIKLKVLQAQMEKERT